MITEAQIDDLVSRVGQGEGVEAIIASMGLDPLLETMNLQAHPTAAGRIKAVKEAIGSDGR